MKIIGIDGGARGHVLARDAAQDPAVSELIWLPGNAGIQDLAECYPIAPGAVDGLIEFTKFNRPTAVIVGPEEPLIKGYVDRCRAIGVTALGPTAAAAELEGSKVNTFLRCRKLGIPVPQGDVFDDPIAAERYVTSCGHAVVIKADGPALGKGVVLCSTTEEALVAIDEIMRQMKFGDAGKRVLIQQRLTDIIEATHFFLVSGTFALDFMTAGDYKRAGARDTGLNTGGMGSYAPSPFLTGALRAEVVSRIVQPILADLAEEGTPYHGVLYVGVMIVDGKLYLCEFNARFGDPELSAVDELLDRDSGPNLLHLLLSTTDEKLLRAMRPVWLPLKSVAVVLAAEGYPGNVRKGDRIYGIDEAEEIAAVDFAGIRREDGDLLTNGGRVAVVKAAHRTYEKARRLAYKAADRITYEGKWCRPDIGLNLPE